MAKNPFGKSRWIDAPYAIFTMTAHHGVVRSHVQWEWRVLKTYKLAANEEQFSRWFVAAKSPHTHGEFELGDTYAGDVKNFGRLVAAEPEWLEAYGVSAKVPTPAEWIAAQQ